MGLDAVERGQELLAMPMNQLPTLAREFAMHLCEDIGGCIEVLLTAYAAYAQCVEGLECSDGLYRVMPQHAEWFRQRMDTQSRQLLSQLGFTAREIEAAEELAASREISVCQLLRNGLRISQAQHKGLLTYTWLNDKPVGCGVVE